MLVGQDQKALGALVVPNIDELCHQHLISSHDHAQIKSLRAQGSMSGYVSMEHHQGRW